MKQSALLELWRTPFQFSLRNMSPQLGFIGLGQMGQVRCYSSHRVPACFGANCTDICSNKAISANLVAKADLRSPLVLYNRTLQRAEKHSSKIGRSVVARDLAQLVSTCDVIWTCLQDEKAVLEIFARILTLDYGGKLFVECSTILPNATHQLAQRLQDGGADMVAMPGSSSRCPSRVMHRGLS